MYAEYSNLLDRYNELLEDLNDVIADIDDGDTEITEVFEKLKSIHPYWND